ncbi:MAG: T9SS type A sorting domain-containing protein [Flavobacteriales bacterium]|nr:T9SS type A sorting domain-containing protein [Flavobacteriales bacterium]
MKKLLLLLLSVSSILAFSQDTLIVGTDALVNSPTGYPAPYGNYYWGAKHQFLIQSCELTNNGQILDSIKGLAFDVAVPEGEPLEDFTVKIGHTPASELTTWITGLTTVFFDTSFVEVTGWNFHDFDTAFKYNGVDNIVVEVCFNNGQFTNNAQTFLSQTSYNSSLFFRDDAVGVCPSTSTSGLTNFRPNMAFSGTMVDVATDLSVEEVLSPTSLCGLGAAEIISVKLFNYGDSSETQFNMGFSVNGGPAVSETFTSTIAPGTSEPFTFSATADLSGAQNILKIWVSLVGDQVICNDTLTVEYINSSPITTFPYIEDFDLNGGFLVDLTTDSLDWIVQSGPTTSVGTGPNGDHTTDSTNYAYIEASSPNSPLKSGILESPCIQISSLTNPYLEFWYHMWGQNMGTLTVEISNGLSWVKAWEKTGDQGNTWKKGKVYIPNFSSDQQIKYRFIGETGLDYESDIAIDDIVVMDAPTQHDLAVVEVFNVDTGFLCLGSNSDTLVAEIGNCGTFSEVGFDVSWSLNGGAASSVTVTDTLIAGGFDYVDLTALSLAPGSYTLKIWTSLASDAVPGNDTATYSFTIVTPPSANLNDTNVCNGDTLTLDAGPGFNNYYWEALSQGSFGFSQTFDVHFADTILIELVDSFGCFNADTFLTSVIPLTPVDLGNDTTLCSGDLITLDPGTFSSYLWPDGSTNQTFNFTSTPAVDTVITVEITDGNGCSNTDDIRLIYIDVLAIDLGPDTSVCPGFILDAGVGNGSYLWSTGDTTQWIVANTSGTYYVDVNKCGTASDTIVLNVSTFPAFDIGQDTTICANDSVLLDATVSGPYWYDWDNGDTTATTYVSDKCKYSLDMYDSFGDDWNGGSIDFYVNGVQVGNYSALNFFSNAMISVEDGDSLDLIYNSGSFESENTYELYSPSGDLLFQDGPFPSTGLVWSGVATCYQNGYFGVNIIDTVVGCVARDSIKINFSSPKVDLGADTSICSGTAVTFTAGPAVSYLWSTASTAQSISVSTVGPYWVLATDSVGCQASDTVEILANFPSPVVDLGNDTTICASDNISLSVAAGFSNVLWSDNSTGNAVFANGGTWWVNVTDTNSCMASDTIVISNLPVPSVNIGPDTSLCPGDTLVVDAGAGFNTYQWSHGFLTQTAEITATGTYWVDVTDSIGCIGSDTIVVNVFNVSLNVDLGNDTIICKGDSVLLNADVGSSNAVYSWNGGSSASMIYASSSNLYSVTVTVCGITDQDTIDVTVSNPPTVSLGNDTIICDTSTLVLDAGPGFVNYAWSTLATTQTITASTAGTYSVTVTDNIGCNGADAILIGVDTCDVGINELVRSDLSFSIYPNPTSQDEVQITFDSKTNSPFELRILNLNGSVVSVFQVPAQYGRFTRAIDISDLAQGVYQVQLVSNKVYDVRKMVIQ